ncbi:helix-turn-helix domain-containing protein [Brevibacillus borstelensis]|uniref:helix-turn-helix transcriptional regulator n=1 Tax=Brevibacillus borstelensis TaxID=45462 RepID=UPI000563F0A6
MRIVIGRCHLLELLNDRNLSQAEFARRIDAHPQTVAKWVKREDVMSLAKVLSACRILSCSIDELYEIIEEKTDE